jgi:hypothetical protein
VPSTMRAAIVAALAFVAACDGGAPGASTTPPPVGAYSCQASFPGADGGMGMLAVCLDVDGGSAQDLEKNRQQCETEGNTFVLAPCPHEGALGGCRDTTPAAVLTTWYYADGSQTPDDIRMLCEGLASVGVPGVTIQFVTP